MTEMVTPYCASLEISSFNTSGAVHCTVRTFISIEKVFFWQLNEQDSIREAN